MQIESLSLTEIKIITPKQFRDSRGHLSETYNKLTLANNGINLDFVQDNHSSSKQTGVLRGLHFQIPPFAQDKLVRVIKGKIFDVAVDIRQCSPTYGRWVGVEISAIAQNQILVPIGFAHGFITMEPETEVIYKVTSSYSPEHEKGIAWNDPAIGIKWPLNGLKLIMSDKDTKHPLLADLPSYFQFDC
ncbi:dTDP-4-dehydrorhamnose 3,5-epimerase [Candidatus Endolissoclinum faulkneri L2]|uniref:dTDP-4-dehydrorhamnose 3,5-epimerase n=1 Tax=Candidatus Endolissoclinum faulkneri L2 TaxID=1193729 RepID=K7YNT8_9PROT|nr:dTDP-4-dehydrorhamnose 3,5-epimerase [Candidatus Endolissoclinum faulkneri]AFX99212.1 dTDP-4-dehydrorhamnose 3,5-epimerase [Candidatus Endolissoclinum faulkneri L2]